MATARAGLRCANACLATAGAAATGGAAWLMNDRNAKKHLEERLQLPWAAPLLLSAGVLVGLFSLLGLLATSTGTKGRHSPCLWSTYHFLTLVAFTTLVVATTASFVALPSVESFLERQCSAHPWPDCKSDLPRLEGQVKQHLRAIGGTACGLCVLTFMCVVAAFSAAQHSARGYVDVDSDDEAGGDFHYRARASASGVRYPERAP